MRHLLTFLFCCSLSSVALADDLTETNKNHFWLFRPTPHELMRPISTERGSLFAPDTPHTVDAGHVQLENRFTYSHLHQVNRLGFYSSEDTIEEYEWTPVLGIGLHDRVELQVAADYYSMHAKSRNIGFGPRSSHEYKFDHFFPVTIGLKANICGNDQGSFALAIEPFFEISADGSWVANIYGCKVPFEIRVARNTRLRLMSAFDINDSDYYGTFPSFLETVQLRQRFFDRVDLFAQVGASKTDLPRYDWGYATGWGLSCDVTPNAQIQFGMEFPLETTADRYLILNSAISVRF